MYTIVDLIDKLIEIEQEGDALYANIAESKEHAKSLILLAKILSGEEKNHIKAYKDLKENSLHYQDIEVDFSIYDKASELIYEFARIRTRSEVKSTREILEYALIFEKENLSLLLSVSGLFIKKHEDLSTRNYEILSEMIEEEEKHIAIIEKELML